MRLEKVVLLLLLCSIQFVNAQSWSWEKMGNGVNGRVNAICEFQGQLYIGGNFYIITDSGDSLFNIAQWSGNKWASVGNVSKKYEVSALCVFNQKLYAGLENYTEDLQTRYQYLLTWNGSNWEDPTNDSIYFTARTPWINGVSTLIVFKDSLYVGGSFVFNLPDSSIDNRSESLISWNGVRWSKVGNGKWLKPVYSFPGNGILRINSLIEFNDELLISGSFIMWDHPACQNSLYPNDSCVGLTAWTGNEWNTSWIGTYNFDATLGIYKDNLFSKARSTKGVFIWMQNNWLELNALDIVDDVRVMQQFKGELYIGGNFYQTMNSDTIKNLSKWNGTSSSSIQGWNDIAPNFSFVNALYDFNNQLYVGGSFTTINGDTMNSIAKLSLLTDIPKPIPSLPLAQINLYPNPTTRAFVLEISNTAPINISEIQIFFYDVTGKVFQPSQTLVSSEINQVRYAISTDDLAFGLYFYRVEQGGIELGSGKVVVLE